MRPPHGGAAQAGVEPTIPACQHRDMPIRRLLLLAGFVSGLALSAAEPHALTFEELWAVKRVGPPSLSPDGRWAVVEVTTTDMNENDSPSDLWLLATDGSARRQLTANKARGSGPLW